MKNWSQYALRALSALLIVEIGLRLFLPIAGEPIPLIERRLFWSNPNFDIGLNGDIRFVKSAKVREVAVYGDQIEYDIIYSTNNLGAPDSLDYDLISSKADKNKKPGLLFVGDSFTAGSGGYSWIPKLRKLFSEVPIYGFGVPGAGLFHYEPLIRSLRTEIDFDEIVIMVISGDLYRPYWYPRLSSGLVSACFTGSPKYVVRQGGSSSEMPRATEVPCFPMAQIIDFNETAAKLVKLTKAVYSEQPVIDQGGGRYSGRRLLSYLRENSRFVEITYKIFDLMRGQQNQQQQSQFSLEVLARLHQEFPGYQVHVIHLPEKSEVKYHHYNKTIAKEVQATGAVYFAALEECNWNDAMFHKNDSHPNSLGYDSIVSCVNHYLRDIRRNR